MVKIALKAGPQETDIQNDPAPEPFGLMGYLFDENFLPAYNDPEKVRGLRLISGSRGMAYGYPSAKQWKAFDELGLEGKLS